MDAQLAGVITAAVASVGAVAVAIVSARGSAKANQATTDERLESNRSTTELERTKIDAAAYERAGAIYERTLEQLDKQIERMQREIDRLSGKLERVEIEREELSRQLRQLEGDAR